MHACRVYEICDFIRRKSQRPSDHFAVSRYEIAVSGGLHLSRLRRTAKGFDRFLQQWQVAAVVPATQLIERGRQFLELVEARSVSLQKAFDVCRDLLALPREVLPLDKLLCR